MSSSIQQFRDELATHLLAVHDADDSHIEDKPLGEIAALHDSLHPRGGRPTTVAGGEIDEPSHHATDDPTAPAPTKVFIFRLPVHVLAHSPADAYRRVVASGLRDDDAVITQPGREFAAFYINADDLYPSDFQFAYEPAAP